MDRELEAVLAAEIEKTKEQKQNEKQTVHFDFLTKEFVLTQKRALTTDSILCQRNLKQDLPKYLTFEDVKQTDEKNTNVQGSLPTPDFLSHSLIKCFQPNVPELHDFLPSVKISSKNNLVNLHVKDYEGILVKRLHRNKNTNPQQLAQELKTCKSEFNHTEIFNNDINDYPLIQQLNALQVSPAASNQINPLFNELNQTDIQFRLKQTQKNCGEVNNRYVKCINVRQEINEFELLRPSMPITFDFELDSFQKEAVLLVAKKENVLISAHTSAGKTAVAEYAIASSLRDGMKAIYTAPIKALSNQKFYDFKRRFSSVGILTGDIKLNESASCLIMTTEILRLILYSTINYLSLADVEWVIFDEVHYINDETRGVVWEEILIMLPPHIKLVMLSATFPNNVEFASWVGNTRQQDVHLIATNKRPVPLEHYLYTAKKDRTFLIYTRDNFFVSENLLKFSNFVTEKNAKDKDNKNAKDNKNKNNNNKNKNNNYKKKICNALDPHFLTGFVRHVVQQKNTPCIVFTFSKNKCLEYAVWLSKTQNICRMEPKEVHCITRLFDQYTRRLSAENQSLPQVIKMRELLLGGIAVHHSGILPLLREIVEVLFQKSLIKLLFATETFAMGVNMPARSVAFSGVKKYRPAQQAAVELYLSEYTQMVGRAGRRGKDQLGMVYILGWDVENICQSMRQILTGKQTPVKSQFYLSYGMIIRILFRNQNDESFQGIDLLKKSFYEHSPVDHVSRAASLNHQYLLCQQKLLDKVVLLRESCPACYDKYLAPYRVDLDGENGYERYEKDNLYNRMCDYAKVRSELFELVSRENDFFSKLNRFVFVIYVDLFNNVNMGVGGSYWLAFVYSLMGDSAKNSTNEKLRGSVNLLSKKDARYRNADNFNNRLLLFVIKNKLFKREKVSGNLGMINLLRFCLEREFGKNFGKNVDNVVLDVENVAMSQVLFIGEMKGPAKINYQECVQKAVKLANLVNNPITLRESNNETKMVVNLLINLTKDVISKNFFIHQFENVMEKNLNNIKLNPHNEQLIKSRLKNYLRQHDLLLPYFNEDVENIDEQLNIINEINQQIQAIHRIEGRLSNEDLKLLPEYRSRISVLQCLDYVDRQNVLTFKGRLAARFKANYEVILTELLVDRKILGLKPAEFNAVMSCFLDDNPPKPEEIDADFSFIINKKHAGRGGLYHSLFDSITNILQKFDVHEAKHNIVERRRVIFPHLMELIYEWSIKEKSFSELIKLFNIHEGNAVRIVLRLDELLMEVKAVSMCAGNPELSDFVDTAREAINRDIIFTKSVYHD